MDRVRVPAGKEHDLRLDLDSSVRLIVSAKSIAGCPLQILDLGEAYGFIGAD